MLRAWAAPLLTLTLLLAAEDAQCRSTAAYAGGRQGSQVTAGRPEEYSGQHHLRYIGRRLRQASSNSSSGLQQKIQTTADDATQRVNDGPSGLTAATAAAAAAVPADDSAQRHIWVTIGGKRLDATAGGLEYEDGEEAERSAPADGPLKRPRLAAGLVRRHLKIAPYKAGDFANERAIAWQHIMEGQ